MCRKRKQAYALQRLRRSHYRNEFFCVSCRQPAKSVAVAVPKNHPAALAFVSEFINKALASGSVQRALDNAGVHGTAAAVPTQNH
jgi:hypothetical protein